MIRRIRRNKLEQLDKLLAKIGAQVGTMETKFTTMGTELDKDSPTVADVKTALGAASTALGTAKTDLGKIAEIVKTALR